MESSRFRLPGESMAPLRRILLIGWIAVTTATIGRGQTATESSALPSKKTIEGWLQSGNPRLVAWGAHDALATHEVSLAPDLLALAKQWQPLSPHSSENSRQAELSSGQKEQRDAMAAALDALIQMNVAVPADTLRNLAPDFGNHVAILLARMPSGESEAPSLEFFRSPSGNVSGLQYVSAALLALHPPAGFAGELLAGLTVQARVVVVLPDAEPMGFGFAGDCMGASESPREDWPVVGQYALSKEKSDGSSVVVGGIDPIYFTRIELTSYLGNTCSISMGVYLGAEERKRLIAEMLGIAPEDISWKTEPQTTIAFQSLEQFRIDLLAFVAEQQQMYRRTAEDLEARNLLGRGEVSQSLPRLELKILDARGRDAEPIPKDANLPARVEWSSLPF
jgi:hypothetical protein